MEKCRQKSSGANYSLVKKKVKLQSSKKSGKKVEKCRQKSSGANYSLVKKKKSKITV